MVKLEGKVWKSDKSKFWVAYIESLDMSTQGNSEKDAIAMIKDAIKSLINKKGFRIVINLGKNGKFYICANDTKAWMGFILQRLRMKEGLTIEEVAGRMGSSSKNAYARYEQGKSLPGLEKLSQILGAIGSKRKTILEIAA